MKPLFYEKLGGRCIVINNEGQVLARFSNVKIRDSSLVAEVLAIKEAMDLVNLCGWRKTEFISNSKLVIETIRIILEKYNAPVRKIR